MREEKLEENLLIENKGFLIYINIDYDDEKSYIDVYSKEKKLALARNHKVKISHLSKSISRRKAGDIWKVRNMKLMMRNHDVVMKNSCITSSIDNPCDTRNNYKSITSLIKEAWLKI